MAIENTDLLYVQRPEGVDAGAYKIEYNDLKNAMVAEVPDPPDPPDPVDAYTKAESDAKYLPFAGGNLTGAVTQVEVAIEASGWDLGDSNFFSCGAIDVPNPTNAVAGMSGLIRLTAAPTSWDTNFSTAPTPTEFPSIIPFYVESDTSIRLGQAVGVV